MSSHRFNKKESIVIISSLTSYSTALYIIDALKKNGNSVFVISDNAQPMSNLEVSGAFDLPNLLEKNHLDPTLILFIEGGSMRIFPVGLERVGCLCAWYGIDTHMDYEKHFYIARLFDITFVAQKEFVSRLIQNGIKQVFWLPLAFEPSLHPLKPRQRIYDIAYVGSDSAQIHPMRHRILAQLRLHFPRMWSGKASPKDMGEIYAQSNLVFNKSVNNDINMRFFEAMGAGAVLLTDPIHENGLEELFIEGQHFLIYENENEVVDLAYKALTNSEKLATIGQQARLEILSKHTYLHRAEKLIQIENQCEKLSKPTLGDYFPVLMTLGMSIDAMRVVISVLHTTHNGRSQKIINYVLAFMLSLALIALDLFSVTCRKIRRF